MTRHDEKRHARDLHDAMEYCMAHEGKHYGAGDVRSMMLALYHELYRARSENDWLRQANRLFSTNPEE